MRLDDMVKVLSRAEDVDVVFLSDFAFCLCHQPGQNEVIEMSDKEPVKQPDPEVEEDDEPDEWYGSSLPLQCKFESS